MESVGTSSNEMDAIRRRLGQEGLLGHGLKQTWWDGLTQWLTQNHASAWVGVVASLLLVVGILGRVMQFNFNSMRENEVVRGQAPVHPMESNDKFTKKQTQIVTNLADALAEWEADLIGAGIPYEKIRNSETASEVDLLIKLSKNIELLSESHKRVLQDAPQEGDLILELREK